MKKHLILFLSTLAILACYTPVQRDCKSFKNGTFYYTYEVDGIKKQARFVRNDSIEIDYHSDGKIDTIVVNWINDCEYILKNKTPRTMAEKKSIHIRILSTTDSTYTFESKLVNDPLQRTSKGTVIKTKN